MIDVMIDIETLGLRPGYTILSIGAVYFDNNGLGREFYQVINRKDSSMRGFMEDSNTLEWWEQQGEEAAAVLSPTSCVSVVHALVALEGFLTGLEARVWGNGADFDIALLTEAYRKVGLQAPWSHKKVRCYRTLAAILQLPKYAPTVAHHALEDAKAQAKVLVQGLSTRDVPYILR